MQVVPDGLSINHVQKLDSGAAVPRKPQKELVPVQLVPPKYTPNPMVKRTTRTTCSSLNYLQLRAGP